MFVIGHGLFALSGPYLNAQIAEFSCASVKYCFSCIQYFSSSFRVSGNVPCCVRLLGNKCN